MALPLNYPVTNGLGRLTEICTFPRGQASGQASGTSGLRQLLSGSMVADNDTTILLSDWAMSNNSNTDLPHQGPSSEYLLTADHMILPGALTTCLAPWYIISHMTIPPPKHAEFITRFDRYLKGIFATMKPVFHHSGFSIEHPDVLISIWGWGSKKDAQEYMEWPAHLAFGNEAANFVTAAVSYQGKLDPVMSLGKLQKNENKL